MRKDANPKIYCACSGNTSFFHYRCIKHLLRDMPLESKWYFCSKMKSAIYLICFHFHFLMASSAHTHPEKWEEAFLLQREQSFGMPRFMLFGTTSFVWLLKMMAKGSRRTQAGSRADWWMKADAHWPGGISGKKSGRHNNPWCAQKSVSDGGKHCIQSIWWKCRKPNSMKMKDI